MQYAVNLEMDDLIHFCGSSVRDRNYSSVLCNFFNAEGYAFPFFTEIRKDFVRPKAALLR